MKATRLEGKEQHKNASTSKSAFHEPSEKKNK